MTPDPLSEPQPTPPEGAAAARPSSRSLVDPELLPALDLVPAQTLTAQTLPAIRAGDRDLVQRLSTEAARFPGVRVDSHYVPQARLAGSSADDPAVRLLLCRPTRRAGLRSPVVPAVPAVLWVHGDGYVSGSADLDLPGASALAQDLGCAVAVVDYRLAPEHPYPAALHDCYAALLWLAGQSEALGIDGTRIAVLGESAGGGLAAATCLLARDRAEVAIAYQVLVYPMLDDRTVTRTGHPYAGEFVWSPESNRFGWTCYLGGEPGALEAAPYAVPSRTADLAGLPPTTICVGSLDLFVERTWSVRGASSRPASRPSWSCIPALITGSRPAPASTTAVSRTSGARCGEPSASASGPSQPASSARATDRTGSQPRGGICCNAQELPSGSLK